jgi:hypothetical protein
MDGKVVPDAVFPAMVGGILPPCHAVQLVFNTAHWVRTAHQRTHRTNPSHISEMKEENSMLQVRCAKVRQSHVELPTSVRTPRHKPLTGCSSTHFPRKPLTSCSSTHIPPHATNSTRNPPQATNKLQQVQARLSTKVRLSNPQRSPIKACAKHQKACTLPAKHALSTRKHTLSQQSMRPLS